MHRVSQFGGNELAVFGSAAVSYVLRELGVLVLGVRLLEN